MEQVPDREATGDLPGTLDTIASRPPAFDDAELRELLATRYGIAGELQELVSERDQNIRVTAASGERYVLKIANVAEDPVGI